MIDLANLQDICGEMRPIGIYVPPKRDAELSMSPYGVPAGDWVLWAEAWGWWSDSTTLGYGGETGIRPDTTCTVYVSGVGRSNGKDAIPLPTYCGIYLSDLKPEVIHPAQNVENLYDINPTRYAYSVVVI